MLRAGLLAAMTLVAGLAGAARAEVPAMCQTFADRAEDWYRRAQTLVQSVERLREPPQDGTIRPPAADIDPKMAVTPPRQDATTGVIAPPGSPGGAPGVDPR